MEKMDGMSVDITSTNIERIKELFPNVVNEGKIDFDMLRTVLGDEVDSSREKYQFTWNGKTNSIKLAQSPSSTTLRPYKDKSRDWDTTENIYIEGDNLEVLKQLQKTYYGKIKMIYIDPPYNTGGDFVYKDNFNDSIKNYKEQTSQLQSSNPNTSGRFHSDWLNMMYPRLMLARKLLTDNGFIMISIDDHEQDNLRKICDEIYGENNFVGYVIRKTKSMTADNENGFNLQHESLIIYQKGSETAVLVGEEKTFDNYSNPDNDPNGDWCSGDPSAKSGGPSTYFEIENPYTHKKDFPPNGRYWAFSKESLYKYINDGKIKFKETYSDKERGFIFKRYKKDATSLNEPVHSLFAIENVYMNQASTIELKRMFSENVFDYPKPKNFIKKLVKYSTVENDIVLDFFSGSATTAHAVMEQNAEDSKKRKFILVQIPELINEKSGAYKAGYKTISDIGIERIVRAGNEIKQNKNNVDIGFKVFKLDSTNINPWDNTKELNEKTIFETSSVFKIDRTNEDIVYEIMLKYGIFDQKVKEVKINNKTMYRVGERYMIVCLDNNISESDIKAICDEKPRVVVFKEEGFENDNAKINAEYNLKKSGVEDVKCI